MPPASLNTRSEPKTSMAGRRMRGRDAFGGVNSELTADCGGDPGAQACGPNPGSGVVDVGDCLGEQPGVEDVAATPADKGVGLCGSPRGEPALAQRTGRLKHGC